MVAIRTTEGLLILSLALPAAVLGQSTQVKSLVGELPSCAANKCFLRPIYLNDCYESGGDCPCSNGQYWGSSTPSCISAFCSSREQKAAKRISKNICSHIQGDTSSGGSPSSSTQPPAPTASAPHTGGSGSGNPGSGGDHQDTGDTGDTDSSTTIGGAARAGIGIGIGLLVVAIAGSISAWKVKRRNRRGRHHLVPQQQQQQQHPGAGGFPAPPPQGLYQPPTQPPPQYQTVTHYGKDTDVYVPPAMQQPSAHQVQPQQSTGIYVPPEMQQPSAYQAQPPPSTGIYVPPEMRQPSAYQVQTPQSIGIYVPPEARQPATYQVPPAQSYELHSQQWQAQLPTQDNVHEMPSSGAMQYAAAPRELEAPFKYEYAPVPR